MPRKALPIKNQVIAMIAQNIKHTEIAKALNCSVATVSRISREVTADVQLADDRLTQLRGEISKVITVESRAAQYAKLATSAKNEAVSLGALQRIDDLDGIVTEKERIRAKQNEAREPAPMFVLPEGATVNVTVNQQNNVVQAQDVVVDKSHNYESAVSDTKQTER